MPAKSKQNIKTFENPEGGWNYKGSFSVELTPNVSKSIVPSSAEIRGDTIHVSQGRIIQVMGGIQFYSENKPFSFGYPRIKAIRDRKGNLLWVNDDHR